jgi:hypothetical protein
MEFKNRADTAYKEVCVSLFARSRPVADGLLFAHHLRLGRPGDQHPSMFGTSE